MEIIQSAQPVYAVAAALLAVIPICLSGEKRRNLREAWTFLAAFATLYIVTSMLPDVLEGKVMEYGLLTVLPGLEIKFRVDALGMLFASVASFLWIFTSIYSIGYMRSLNEECQTRFFAYFAVSMAATMGAAFAANMFTLFLFYEAITLATFPLVAHEQTPEAIRGGRIYLVYLLGTSLLFLMFAIVLTYVTAGTLEFSLSGILAGKASDLMLTVIFILYIAGIAKAGIMPFHGWLPSAMVAPTPVSALLHAVAVVKVGVFTVIRVALFIFGDGALRGLHVHIPAAYVASFTIITASFIALTKDNLKARLAYSTISQLSYIALGVFLLTPAAMVGGIFHIASHAFSKITLFFCAGSIYAASHRKNVSELAGIGRKLPLTMFAFFIGSLGMIGIPPISGFVSKWYLSLGALKGGNAVFMAVLLVSSLLNAAYFLPIVYKAFFEKPENPHEDVREIPLMVLPLMVTAIGAVLIGVFPDFFIRLAELAVRK